MNKTRVALAVALALASASAVHASPAGGRVVAGEASITGSQSSTVIHQSSQNAAINWQSFDIGVGESVQFVQPNSSAIALNRVLGSDASKILGNLSANGKVFLVNPNGILFGNGASVNVGGLVASTRDLSITDFLAGRYRFEGNSRGSVVNQGSIRADGGYVALLGANVSNEGVIAAKLGTVALASGDALTLDVAGDGLLNVTVNAGSVGALAENGGLIQADGGNVLLTAHSAGGLMTSAVNNTGVIQARSIQNHNGVIRLMGDMTDGTVNVGGALDASAPDSGDGGFIETSAAYFEIDPATQITTAAPYGTTGQWLIDPVDFTIAATGGDITGTALSAMLGSTNVSISSVSGSTGTSGDVNVNDRVGWSANKLTLTAQNNININSTMYGGGTAQLALEYGQGAVALNNTSVVNVREPVVLPSGANLSMKLGSDGSTLGYTVINDMSSLQAIASDLNGRYALGNDLDANGFSFTPIGTLSTYDDTPNQFKGVFDGLGHRISRLTINQPSSNFVGLFGGLSDTGVVRNVGLVDVNVTGLFEVGPLVSFSYGTVLNSHATGTVTGMGDVGGLIGYQRGGRIASSWTNTAVTATDYFASAGGITSDLEGAELRDSYALGSVDGRRYTGGLVGLAQGATVINSFASTSLPNGGGGLVGWGPFGTVAVNSYWDVTRSGATGSDGGGTGLTTTQLQSALPTGFSPTVWGNGSNQTLPYLLGNVGQTRVLGDSATYTVVASIDQLQAMEKNRAGLYVLGNDIDASATQTWNGGAGFHPLGDGSQAFSGTLNGLGHTIFNFSIYRPGMDEVGLFGRSDDPTLSNIGLTNASVEGRDHVGGLVGFLMGSSGTVSGAYVTGSVQGDTDVGGLIGRTLGGSIRNSYSNASVVANSDAGGLIGWLGGAQLSGSYAAGSVSASANVGGLIVLRVGGGSVADSYWNRSANPGLDPVTGGDSAGDATGITSLTDAQFKTNVSFVASSPGDWDFSDTWVQYEGHTAPLLRAFMKPLTVAVNDVTRTYDGAAYSGTPGVTYSFTPDLGKLNGTLAYANNGINVGSYALSASGLYSGQTGYLIDFVDGVLTIDPRAVSFSGTRMYDGTNGVSASDLTLTGLVSGQTLSLTGSGTVASKNVGNGKAVSLGTLALGDGSGLASNYTLLGGTLDITPAVVTVAATAANKVYDGTTAATASLALSGLVRDETLDVDGTATFNSKDVGNAKLVTVSDLALADGSNGGLAANYMLASNTATANASITAPPDSPAPPAPPSEPPTSEPTTPQTPPPPLTSTEPYRGAVSSVTTRAPVDAQAIPVVTQSVSASPTVRNDDSTSRDSESYEVPGLNLRVVTRDESLPAQVN